MGSAGDKTRRVEKVFDVMMTVIGNLLYDLIFFFKQKTAYEILTCDWSSDVCSSDLPLF